jgi:hypothetical protein
MWLSYVGPTLSARGKCCEGVDLGPEYSPPASKATLAVKSITHDGIDTYEVEVTLAAGGWRSRR